MRRYSRVNYVCFCAFTLSFCVTPGRTATLVVDLNGGRDFTAIQPAIDAAQAGDTVLVKAGEYVITEPISFKGKSLTVRSESGANATMIRMPEPIAGQQWPSILVFENEETAGALFDGFGLPSSHYIRFLGSSPRLRSCTISGVIVCDYSSPVLHDCNLSGQVSCTGSSPTLRDCNLTGGISCAGSSPTLTNCMISSKGYAIVLSIGYSTITGIVTGSFPTLNNCIISGSGSDGILCDGSSPTLINCTISGNLGSGVTCRSVCWVGNPSGCSGSSPTLTNCIVWGNGAQSIVMEGDDSTPIVSYSLIDSSQVWPGTGNIREDPQFCGWDAAHVWADAGRTGPGTGTQEDPYANLSLALAYGLGLRQGSPCLGTGKDGVDMGAALGTCEVEGAATRVVHLAPGSYSIAGLSLLNNVSLEGAGQTETVIVGAVEGLRTGAVLSGLMVSGSPGGGGVVVGPGQSPVIRDCIISGNGGSGIVCDRSSPTITNCRVSGNVGRPQGGGGVWCHGASPVLSNCTISGNSAGYSLVSRLGGGGAACEYPPGRGGGVYCRASSPILRNCIISGNIADRNCLDPGLGGGLYCEEDSAPMLANCTIFDNVADGSNSGGLFSTRSSPMLTNCIVWGNVVGAIDGDSPIVSYSCVESLEVWPGAGNILDNPQFCGWPAPDMWVDAGQTGPGNGTEADPYPNVNFLSHVFDLGVPPRFPRVDSLLAPGVNSHKLPRRSAASPEEFLRPL